MSEKNDRLYSRQHEWAIFREDGTCLVGISDYAQSELGNIVFANLPEVGDSFVMLKASRLYLTFILPLRAKSSPSMRKS